MALNHHLPQWFLKVNRHKIPYITLYANFGVGILSFLPFPGWQKLVAFLSSASILSYSIGPICLLAMRKLQPQTPRPFKVNAATFIAYSAFYICNLMLYWCGFDIIWKLDAALILGLILCLCYQRQSQIRNNYPLYWFVLYMIIMFLISYFGSFGGTGFLRFPFDLILLLPLSMLLLSLSQFLLRPEEHQEIICDGETSPA